MPGHFNVLRGAIHGAVKRAGVKVISRFLLDNYKEDLPSELGTLLLFEPAPTARRRRSSRPARLTDMRTGAVSAIGAKYLARKNAKILGHIGARGTAYWNVRLMRRLFDFDEIRVHSRRKESRKRFGERLRRDLGKTVVVTADWESCVRGADIVVEASRLVEPEPLLKTAWIKTGALVMPYGTMSAVELSLTDIMDKILMDDWGQRAAPRARCAQHVDSGPAFGEEFPRRTRPVVAGPKPGRERDDETILLWHRGLSLSDIALGHAMLEKAARLGIGQRLRFA